MDCHRTVGVDFLQEFDVHIIYPVLEVTSILLEFPRSRIISVPVQPRKLMSVHHTRVTYDVGPAQRIVPLYMQYDTVGGRL